MQFVQEVWIETDTLRFFCVHFTTLLKFSMLHEYRQVLQIILIPRFPPNPERMTLIKDITELSTLSARLSQEIQQIHTPRRGGLIQIQSLPHFFRSPRAITLAWEDIPTTYPGLIPRLCDRR